jgi:tetratricopeptide (TPR) repeat protein
MLKETPTQNSEAFSSFIRGRTHFESYLETGNLGELSKATECFQLSIILDPNFHTAKLYKAVSLTEQGSAAEAIKDLKALISDPHFQARLDARVQLAHSYARRGEYEKALLQLREAKKEAARRRRDRSKLCLIDAYSALLMAAQGPGSSNQLTYAIELANKSGQIAEKKNDEVALAARFEAKIATGIAHMRLYDKSEGNEKHNWTEAQRALLSASELRPNSPRALYNVGRLYMSRGYRDPKVRKESYETAERILARVLEIAPFDEAVRTTKDFLESQTGQQAMAEEHPVRPDLAISELIEK